MPWWCPRSRRWRARRRREAACAQVDVSSTGSIATLSESRARVGKWLRPPPRSSRGGGRNHFPTRESRRRGPSRQRLCKASRARDFPGPALSLRGAMPMGIRAWLSRLGAALGRLWRGLREGRGLSVAELARRLDMPEARLSLNPTYQPRQIPKRSGGTRLLHVPEDDLKDLQRRILRRLLKRLRCHAAARGFQPGESIV